MERIDLQIMQHHYRSEVDLSLTRHGKHFRVFQQHENYRNYLGKFNSEAEAQSAILTLRMTK